MSGSPLNPEYTRFPFLVLPYNKKHLAVGKELMVDYENNILYVKSEDGTQDIALTDPDLKLHLLDFNNPHRTTKEHIGLGNVFNIVQASKEEFDIHITNFDNPHKVTKEQVGLGNVLNIMPASKLEYDELKAQHDALALILEDLKNRPGHATLYELKIDTEPPEAKVRVFYNNKWNDGKLHNVPEGEYSYEVFVSDDVQKFDLIIRPYPIDSDVYVYYNNTWNAGNEHLLQNGTYQVKVLKSGYVERIVNVTISDVSKTEIVRLTKIGYTLTINPTPEDALVKVYYDGGYNEGYIHANLSNGTYPVQVSKYGYASKEEVITISNGNVTQSIILDSNNYSLIVSTNPGDAKVEIFYNGNWNVGTTHSLPNGEYDIKVSKLGYSEYVGTVIINNLNKTESISLERSTYKLTVVTVPSNAIVEVIYDGATHNGNIHNIPTGSYNIKVSYPGYDPYIGTVSILNEDKIVSIDLSESRYSLYINTLPPTATVKVKVNNNWETGLNNVFLLPNGTYEYLITANQYKSVTGFITIDEAGTTLNIELEKLNALEIIPNPYDSEVKVKINDSWVVGTLHFVEPGSYDIEVIKSGYVTHTETILVDGDIAKEIILTPIIYTLTINTSPEDSNVEVYYDGIWNVGKIHNLPNGDYEIKVNKEGYNEYINTVTISGGNVVENITLDITKYTLTIETTPEDSVVEVEYDSVWNIGKIHTLPNGTYNVQVTRDGYIQQTKSVTILDSNKTEIITLVEDSYTLTVTTIPEEASVEVYYNDQWNSGKVHTLKSGSYNIRTTLDGYVQGTTSVIVQGSNRTEDIILEKLYTLTITPTPADATVKVYYDLKWNTGNIHNLPNGSYNVECSKTGYLTKNQEIAINNEDVSINISLAANHTITVNTTPSSANIAIRVIEDYTTGTEITVPIEDREFVDVSNPFNILRPTLYTIRASKSGYIPRYVYTRTLSDETFNMTLNPIVNDQYLGTQTGLITGTELFDLLSVPNETYSKHLVTGDITWHKFKTYDNKDLLIPDRPLMEIDPFRLKHYELFTYSSSGYVTQGKVITIDGVQYRCRLPKGANVCPINVTETNGSIPNNVYSGELERLILRYDILDRLADKGKYIHCQESATHVNSPSTEYNTLWNTEGCSLVIDEHSLAGYVPVLEKI